MLTQLIENLLKKWSCFHDCHDWEEIHHVTTVDEFNDIVGHTYILKCKNCGKIKKIH